MSISEFRKKKLLHVFNVFFDENNSGTIDEKDFDIAVVKITKLRNWAADGPEVAHIRQTLTQVWESLKEGADQDHDGVISIEEWCGMWANGDMSNQLWQQQYLDFFFELEDTSGDGTIDLEEFVKLFANYGISKDECSEAFNRLSKNNAVEVTKPEFAKLWHEYFTSDNPDAPGNCIFGKSKFT